MHGPTLYVSGRLKDMMILAGRNIFPNDVEACCSAVGADDVLGVCRPGGAVAFQISRGIVKVRRGRDVVTDEMNGDCDDDVMVVAVELRDDAAAAAAIAALGPTSMGDICRAVTQSVTAGCGVRPGVVVLVKARSLPKTTSGKVRRFEARERFSNGTLAALYTCWNEFDAVDTGLEVDNLLSDAMDKIGGARGDDDKVGGGDVAINETEKIVLEVVRNVLALPRSVMINLDNGKYTIIYMK